ncbi:MAG: alpha-galactosidase [Spirochaetaceae bacterium]|nr:alpha-galactosidase [Spirochaetaceae bacterium]
MKAKEPGHFHKLFPIAHVELKFGTNRKRYPLEVVQSSENKILYRNEWIEVLSKKHTISHGSSYSLTLKNLSDKSIRITRLRFPATDGVDRFLENLNPKKISFLRNGHQSWSTTRTYRVSEKPLRPRFRLMSLATSNMANLPSNTPGMLSSEMYSIIMDLDSRESMLVGQSPPFDQFFYIILNVNPRGKESFFELIYDFGRQLLKPGQKIQLDGIILLKGSRPEVEQKYFHRIREATGFKVPDKNLRGWCSWYQYYDKITPEILYKNLKAIKEKDKSFDFFQIDDGYQKAVGDWLEQKPAFNGRMQELACAIKEAGMKPGIWLAPFTVAEKSDLFKTHPEYVLKNETGRKIKASYNPFWKCFYYGLDVTHPRYAEYVTEVIDTYVNQWGFDYLKCDFLFSASLRGAVHHNLALSRASVLKSGMELIRQAAGQHTQIIGCGMPLSTGIGYVNAMRVGPDTGDYWINPTASIVRTGCMFGVRNSVRNFMVRSPMHKRLWLNDPDCLMIRDKGTGLTRGERRLQMDAIAISGGILMFSDDFSTLSDRALSEMELIEEVSQVCFSGQAIAIDVMERELPEIYYNTSGYLALFNFHREKKKSTYDLSALKKFSPEPVKLVDLRNGEEFPVSEKTVVGNMMKRDSRLFRVERVQ